VDHLVSTIPILITVTVVIVGATWRLLASINTVDKRVSRVERQLLSNRMDERERTEKLIERRIAEHHNACRAAQEFITGVGIKRPGF
jgi:hypothetical protein